MIRPRITETIAALGRAVKSAGLDFDGVDRILLVGGTSRIPLVAEMVREATGRPVGGRCSSEALDCARGCYVAETRRLARSGVAASGRGRIRLDDAAADSAPMQRRAVTAPGAPEVRTYRAVPQATPAAPRRSDGPSRGYERHSPPPAIPACSSPLHRARRDRRWRHRRDRRRRGCWRAGRGERRTRRRRAPSAGRREPGRRRGKTSHQHRPFEMGPTRRSTRPGHHPRSRKRLPVLDRDRPADRGFDRGTAHRGARKSSWLPKHSLTSCSSMYPARRL